MLGAADGEIRAVDPTRGTILLRSQGMGQLGELRAGTSGRLIVAGRLTGETEVHDGLKGGLVCPPLQQTGMLTAVALSPDERWVATGGFSGSSRIWEVRTGQPMTPSLRQGSMVFDLEFLPGSEQLATTSQDTTARIWTLTRTDMPVRQLEAVATVLSGRRISYGRGPAACAREGAYRGLEPGPSGASRIRCRRSREVAARGTRGGRRCTRQRGQWAEAVPYFDRAIRAGGPPRATLHCRAGLGARRSRAVGFAPRATFSRRSPFGDSDAELWRPCCSGARRRGRRPEPGRPAPRCSRRFGSSRNPDPRAPARRRRRATLRTRAPGLDRREDRRAGEHRTRGRAGEGRRGWSGVDGVSAGGSIRRAPATVAGAGPEIGEPPGRRRGEKVDWRRRMMADANVAEER